MKRVAITLAVTLLAVGLYLGFKSPKLDLKPWMESQIQEDLSAFKAQDTQPELLRAYFKRSNPRDLLVFYQIKGNKVFWSKNWEGNKSIDRVRKSTQMLERMTRTRKLPDVEFLLSIHDGWFRTQDAEVDDLFDEIEDDFEADPRDVGVDRPTFTYAKKAKAPAILFPDPLSESFARSSRKSIERSNKRLKYRWGKKENIAFWRGGTTGRKGFTKETWFLNPRSKLSMLSNYYPDLVDSGYTTFPGVKADARHAIEAVLPKVSWTTHKEHLKYKYLVIPDGNTCTYPRYYLGLCSNSVVFKQDSTHIQWFYKALKPFIHYVPVSHDFSDLPERVTWAKNHDAKVKSISKNATAFIKKNLMPRHIHDYVEGLLFQYAKLQKASDVQPLEGARRYSYFKEKK